VFWAAKRAIPHMRRAGHGSIINISSASSLAGVGGHPAYCTAKAGMNGLTRSIADAYAAENIRCNAIVLGFVSSSPEVEAMVAALGDRLTKTQMMPRAATVQEIGAFASFLAGAEAYPITGASITVDNGWTNKLPVIDPHDIQMAMSQT
jgi:3-hydroxybutyrate dehydrogenase